MKIESVNHLFWECLYVCSTILDRNIKFLKDYNVDKNFSLKTGFSCRGAGSQHQREEVARQEKWAWLALGKLDTYRGHKTDKDHR